MIIPAIEKIEPSNAYRQLDDEIGQANILYRLGNLEQVVGQRDRARKLFEDALELYHRNNDMEHEAHMAYHLGMLLAKSDVNEAKRYLETAAALYVEMDAEQWHACTVEELKKLER